MRRRAGKYLFTFLLMFAIGLGLPISPLLASQLGATWIEVGLMGAAWGVVFTFSAVLTGRISDRIGRKPVLAMSGALSALAALLFIRASSVSELIAIRGLEGLAWSCFWPVMEALATETADTEQVGKGIGLVTTVYTLAFAIGSFAGGFIAGVYGFSSVFATYCGMASLATLTILFVEERRPAAPQQKMRSEPALSEFLSKTVVSGNFLGASYTFGLASVMALLSVYAIGLGIPVFWIGVIFSIFWTGRVIGAVSAGSASDRFGRKRVALFGLILGSAGFLLVGLAAESRVLVIGTLLAGFSVGAAFPVSVAMIADGIGVERRGGAMGLYEMVCASVFMMASALGGFTSEVVSPRTPYAFSSAIFVSCAIVLPLLLAHHK